MRPHLAICLLAVVLSVYRIAAALAQAPPESQPASAPDASQSARAADNDLRQQLEQLRERMTALEAKHAEEHAQDQKRIAELEAKVAELEGPSIEIERIELMRQQLAEIRREMAREAGLLAPMSQPGTQPTPGAEGELEAAIAGAAPPTAPETKPSGVLGTIQAAIQSFNPDISLNGDFLAMCRSHEGHDTTPKFRFRELEIGFSGAVDPYTRADAIMTVDQVKNEFETGLEEAYLTFLQLPWNLQARIGIFRAEFGRANPMHLHALPWIDYPFVIQRYFGEDGLSGTGGELSWLVPNPWDQYIALIYEIMNNDNETLFAADQATDVTNLLRLKWFHDLSPASTLEFGGSVATGPNDRGHGGHRSTVEGLDLTYRWKPKGEGLYRSFLWQTEVLAAQADIIGGRESTWGMYSAAEYQFARRWKFGVRYDQTELPFEASDTETGYSAYLTFLQSEFVYWRLAYMIINRNFSDDGVSNEQRLMLQLNWTLGTHPAHKY